MICPTIEEWPPAGYVEMDLELSLFLSRHARSPLQWDILSFFAANPHTRDTASALVERLGRQNGAVRRELEDFVLLGILSKDEQGGPAIYRLRRDPALQGLMERLRRHLGAAGKPARPRSAGVGQKRPGP